MAKADDWILAKWQRDGWPMAIRMAKAYLGFGSVPGYEYRVIVAVQLRDPKPSGHPSDAEWDDLKAFELNVCRLLEAENESLCVLVVTGQGVRDIFFYAKDPEQVKRSLAVPRSVLGSHTFELNVELEPDWLTYRSFSKMISSSKTPEIENPI